MNEVIDTNNKSYVEELTDNILKETRNSIKNDKTMNIPISELSTLGAAVSSLAPEFNTITQEIKFQTGGLFRIANALPGDQLKISKQGTAWGSLKTAEGKSKMMQLSQVDSVGALVETQIPINPATIMMAATLYSIEKDLKGIEKTQKQILEFLEIEKESEIESDVETLMEIVSNYKYNWDNELSVKSNHKLVVDIKRNSRKNMITYEKKIPNLNASKMLIVGNKTIKNTLDDVEKNFKYYRLSLYTFALSSMLEIILSSNFKEEYIQMIKAEIEDVSYEYRKLFMQSSLYIEKMSSSQIEANVVKGIGLVGKTMGKIIGSIPMIKEGQVDEFLQEKGAIIQQNGIGIEKEAVKKFAEVSNPNTKVFIDKMEDMINIYNHTSQICFDDKNVYLIEK